MTPNEWNDERVNLLAQMRSDGISRRDIVGRLNDLTGSKFTLGAVVGKIDRLFPAAKPRLTPEQKVANRKKWRARDAARKRARRARGKGMHSEPPPRKPKPAFECREIEASPLHVSFSDLETGMCRYPYGDDARTMTFCGSKIVERRFWYCAVHMMLCTRPFVAKVAA